MPSYGTARHNERGNEMSDSSPDVAALFVAGRSAFRPSASDRDRVLRSLTVALGEGAVDGTGDGRPQPASRLTLRRWLFGGLAAVVALGSGAVLGPNLWNRGSSGTTPPPIASSPTPTAATAMTASSSSSDVGPDSGLFPTEHDTSSPRTGARLTTHATSDSLAEEVALLSRAERQMNDGLTENALKTLAEHEKRFPSGALTEERMAARVRTLCSLGRSDEAKSELARFARIYPRSPHIERDRKLCGFDMTSMP